MIDLAAEVTTTHELLHRSTSARQHFSSSERRTLGGVLGFLAGLAALGPVAALGAAFLGALAARLANTR